MTLRRHFIPFLTFFAFLIAACTNHVGDGQNGGGGSGTDTHEGGSCNTSATVNSDGCDDTTGCYGGLCWALCGPTFVCQGQCVARTSPDGTNYSACVTDTRNDTSVNPPSNVTAKPCTNVGRGDRTCPSNTTCYLDGNTVMCSAPGQNPPTNGGGTNGGGSNGNNGGQVACTNIGAPSRSCPSGYTCYLSGGEVYCSPPGQTPPGNGGSNGGGGSSGAEACGNTCVARTSQYPQQAAYYCAAACVYRCYGMNTEAAAESAKACQLGTCNC